MGKRVSTGERAGCVALGLLMALAAPRAAPAHEFYAIECCSGNDCRPVDDPGPRVEETPTGYRWQPTGEIVPYGDRRIRQSPDGRFHICTVAGALTGKVLCIYEPGRLF